MFVNNNLIDSRFLTLDGTAVGFFVGAELGEDEGVLVGTCFLYKENRSMIFIFVCKHSIMS